MTFWEIGVYVGLWSTAHFVYNSGASRGGTYNKGCPIFLALSGYYGQPVLSIYFYLIFLYHVNQCMVQLSTNKVVVVVFFASIHYHSTETDILSIFYIPANI